MCSEIRGCQGNFKDHLNPAQAEQRPQTEPQPARFPKPRAVELAGSGVDAKKPARKHVTSIHAGPQDHRAIGSQDCLPGSPAAAHSTSLDSHHLYTADPVFGTSTSTPCLPCLARPPPSHPSTIDIDHRLCIPTCTADFAPLPRAHARNFMQSGLIETPNHDFRTTNAPLSQPTTAQHGPGRSRSSLPDARSPRAPSTCLDDAQDAQGSGCAAYVYGLDVDHLDQTLGRLSVAETNSAAATRATVTVAGQRIAEYENAAISSSPRRDSHPPLGFKVTHSSRSDGVQLVDFPNGSSLPSRAASPPS